MQLKNDRLIRALLRQPVDRTPIWIMRQAGRYLPEYRKLREQAGSFMNLCKNPELACEITLQPLERFDLDAAILFSDILTIPDAMGLGLYFVEHEGPRFSSPLQCAVDIKRLAKPDPEVELRYVTDTIRLLRKALAGRVPLIGFAGSPWTLATYMIEGGSSKQFSKIKSLLYQQPQLLKKLLNLLADSVSDYLNAQIRAGVQTVMIFDTWGGVLSTEAYKQFSLHYMQQIIANLIKEHEDQRIATILFAKNAGQRIAMLVETGCDAIGIDWTIDIDHARAMVKGQVALQGNLDPAVLYAQTDIIREHVANILDRFGANTGHVFNLGHGIHQDTPIENVACLVSAVHELSQPYHFQGSLS